MFKSIFSKYFTVVAVVVLGSFVALCGAQTLLSSRYWTEEKQETLCQSAESVAAYTASYTHPNGDGYIIEDTFKPFFRLLSETDLNLGRVQVVSGNGTVVLSSTGAEQPLPAELMRQVVQQCTPGNPWFFTGNLGGVYKDTQYNAVATVVHEGKVIAYAIVSSPTDKLTEYLVSNLQVFLASAITVLAITFAVMYLLTYRLVRPLRQMAEATRRFAEGDFSYRLKVRGRDEVAELAASLNSMAVSLSSVEDMRRSFVSNISHELKTPMTTIAGFIDGVLDGTVPAEKRAHYLKIVSDEVKRLSRLVRSMLDLSRIDSGRMQLTPTAFDLTDVVCHTLLSFEPRLEERQVTVAGLEDTPSCAVVADRDLVGQVVYNLLDNATKFINEGGTLTLSLEQRGNRVYTRLRNTGLGVPAPELPHIFERFYKSDQSRSLDKQGVGLGLYIVKTVISLHGGEIAVRSVEGEYCEFEFWLPAAEIH
ncbi:MAG: HAMP domain-containing histidine kinase [Clostridia bacterium]|nr:HAMP domain-containing histidine kinase [Clostridia bacterium]